jgi:tRNA (cytidine/uridine-2'-O-)-methyltransferase
MSPALHLVLLAPEIPWNTGNIGRTCLASGAQLHLVRPLGFSLEERRVRRAGLDYWRFVEPRVWSGWRAFEQALPELGTPWFFSAEGQRPLYGTRFEGPTVLVFGSETAGLPPAVRQRYAERLLAIPMEDGPVRSLNLSTAAAVAAYEVRRQHGA